MADGMKRYAKAAVVLAGAVVTVGALHAAAQHADLAPDSAPYLDTRRSDRRPSHA